jgi:hypothetical protein
MKHVMLTTILFPHDEFFVNHVHPSFFLSLREEIPGSLEEVFRFTAMADHHRNIRGISEAVEEIMEVGGGGECGCLSIAFVGSLKSMFSNVSLYKIQVIVAHRGRPASAV